MRWENTRNKWVRKFVWLPVLIENIWIWLEVAEYKSISPGTGGEGAWRLIEK